MKNHPDKIDIDQKQVLQHLLFVAKELNVKSWIGLEMCVSATMQTINRATLCKFINCMLKNVLQLIYIFVVHNYSYFVK